MQDEYLTAAEVAKLFKLNVETVYDLVGNGQLPATKLGGQWRFDASEIREWFRQHRSTTSGAVNEKQGRQRADR